MHHFGFTLKVISSNHSISQSLSTHKIHAYLFLLVNGVGVGLIAVIPFFLKKQVSNNTATCAGAVLCNKIQVIVFISLVCFITFCAMIITTE